MADQTIHEQSAVSIRPHQISPISPETVADMVKYLDTLQEYDAESNTYSGKEIRGTILYVLHEYPAIQKDYVVFSFCVDQYIEKANLEQ